MVSVSHFASPKLQIDAHVSVNVPAGGDNVFKAVTEEDVMYSDVQVPLISFPI